MWFGIGWLKICTANQAKEIISFYHQASKILFLESPYVPFSIAIVIQSATGDGSHQFPRRFCGEML
jgi:hypothetical protein